MDIRIYKARRGLDEGWSILCNHLNPNYIVNHSVGDENPDISIVLSGKAENPLAIKGKRVLFMTRGEWNPKGYGWNLFESILKHYYDEIVDITYCSLTEAVEKIKDYIENAEQAWQAEQSGTTH